VLIEAASICCGAFQSANAHRPSLWKTQTTYIPAPKTNPTTTTNPITTGGWAGGEAGLWKLREQVLAEKGQKKEAAVPAGAVAVPRPDGGKAPIYLGFGKVGAAGAGGAGLIGCCTCCCCCCCCPRPLAAASAGAPHVVHVHHNLCINLCAVSSITPGQLSSLSELKKRAQNQQPPTDTHTNNPPPPRTQYDLEARKSGAAGRFILDDPTKYPAKEDLGFFGACFGCCG